jgi:HEAT repeat protein
MEAVRIRSLVASFDTRDNAARDAAWRQLRDLGERLLPFFEEFFGRAKRLEARRDIAFHCIRFARTNDAAFRIGLAAVNDRSTIVRYRGCCVLAYSLRRDALLALQTLLSHSDAKTVGDARAAIDAIQHKNHHYFIDREHTDQMFWDVCPGDVA